MTTMPPKTHSEQLTEIATDLQKIFGNPLSVARIFAAANRLRELEESANEKPKPEIPQWPSPYKKTKPPELNKKLLDKLLPWKLKIMPDEDGGTKWVHAVVRIGIDSIEVNYAGNPKYIKAASMEEAANMCMQDLIEKLEARKAEQLQKSMNTQA
jgi:hypothetical protein